MSARNVRRRTLGCDRTGPRHGCFLRGHSRPAWTPLPGQRDRSGHLRRRAAIPRRGGVAGELSPRAPSGTDRSGGGTEGGVGPPGAVQVCRAPRGALRSRGAIARVHPLRPITAVNIRCTSSILATIAAAVARSMTSTSRRERTSEAIDFDRDAMRQRPDSKILEIAHLHPRRRDGETGHSPPIPGGPVDAMRILWRRAWHCADRPAATPTGQARAFGR